MAQLVCLRKGKKDRAPQVINCSPNRPVKIGRDRAFCDYVVKATGKAAHLLVSRHHCDITVNGDGQYVLTDHSMNGSFVNNIRVKVAALKNGDELGFGYGGDHEVGDVARHPMVIMYKFLQPEEDSPRPRRKSVTIASSPEIIPSPPTPPSSVGPGEGVGSLPTDPPPDTTREVEPPLPSAATPPPPLPDGVPTGPESRPLPPTQETPPPEAPLLPSLKPSEPVEPASIPNPGETVEPAPPPAPVVETERDASPPGRSPPAASPAPTSPPPTAEPSSPPPAPPAPSLPPQPAADITAISVTSSPPQTIPTLPVEEPCDPYDALRADSSLVSPPELIPHRPTPSDQGGSQVGPTPSASPALLAGGMVASPSIPLDTAPSPSLPPPDNPAKLPDAPSPTTSQNVAPPPSPPTSPHRAPEPAAAPARSAPVAPAPAPSEVEPPLPSAIPRPTTPTQSPPTPTPTRTPQHHRPRPESPSSSPDLEPPTKRPCRPRRLGVRVAPPPLAPPVAASSGDGECLLGTPSSPEGEEHLFGSDSDDHNPRGDSGTTLIGTASSSDSEPIPPRRVPVPRERGGGGSPPMDDMVEDISTKTSQRGGSQRKPRSQPPPPPPPPPAKNTLTGPRAAFQIFWADQKLDCLATLRATSRRQPSQCDLRRAMQKRWDSLDADERFDYKQKEIAEREHFARLDPQYRPEILNPKQAKKKEQARRRGVGRLDDTSTPAAAVNSRNRKYRERVARVYEEQERRSKEEYQKLIVEDDLHRDYLGVGAAFSGTKGSKGKRKREPETQDTQGSNRPNKIRRLRTPSPEPSNPSGALMESPHTETCRITDVNEYWTTHRRQSHEMPLADRTLNVGRQDGEALEVIPGRLAHLLKAHQLAGVKFLWRTVVMKPMEPITPCETQSTQYPTTKEDGGEDPAHDDVNRHRATQGCVLAHSMGLGKTLTSIVFTMMYLRHGKGNTVLVLAPKSTLHAWRNEFVLWCQRANEKQPEVYVVDDRVNTNEKRMATIRAWVKGGGVLLMGYFLYVQLVGQRIPSSKGKTGAATTTRKKRTTRIDGASSEDDDPTLQKEIRNSYVANSEDEEEERQVQSEVHACRTTREGAAFRVYLHSKAPDCVIVDEGHKLSNPKSCLTRALNGIRTQQRIILTGTPIQNNLWEYFTMVNFIRPGYWDRDEFRLLYANSIRTGQALNSTPDQVKLMEERSEELYRELNKFVDRCDVSMLQRDLPPKHEFVISTSLSKFQAKLYMDLSGRSPATKLTTNKMLALSTILFRIGNHTDLVRDYCIQRGVDPMQVADEDDDPVVGKDPFSLSQMDREAKILRDAKGKDFTWARPVFDRKYVALQLEGNHKMQVLFEIINQCVRLGEKVLVFSQWTCTLDVIEGLLRWLPPPTPMDGQEEIYEDGDALADDGSWQLGRDYFRFEGDATNTKRQHMIDHFNDAKSTSRLMLCSSRAGGLGINLVGATRVVLFDTSWNPMADQQAIYRAYRYGQTRPVYVYRLLNDRTHEDTIFQKCYSKVCLFRRIVDDQALTWRRPDIQAPALIGGAVDDKVQLDANVLLMDDVLERVAHEQRGKICRVAHLQSPLQSDDGERLTQASQVI